MIQLMVEDTVKLVMSHYFKLKDEKATLQRGSGPDFLIAGEAIELKGTNSDFDSAVRQFIDYLLTGKYKGLRVAFPNDFLDAGRLAKFTAFCHLAAIINQWVPTYIIAEDENLYYVRKFDYGKEIWSLVIQEMCKQYSVKKEDLHDLARKANEEFKNYDIIMQDNIRRIVQEKPDTTFLKSSLPQIHPSQGALRKGFDDTSIMNK